MITLEQNELIFSFPDIVAELRRLSSEELTRVTHRLTGENRVTAFEELMRSDYRYRSIEETEKHEAVRELAALIPATIEAAIVRHIRQRELFTSEEKTSYINRLSFQRTLRIPDDGKSYPLPPGLGKFPVCHVDDHGKRVPANWLKRGGVMMPMYQAEALWLSFHSGYPCALKVATGKINAVSGLSWSPGLDKNPQDYLILPQQPWIDGYCVENGYIRQFVAMPLGNGYTAEEQITGKGEHGGLQLQVYPLKASIYFQETVKSRFPRSLKDILPLLIPPPREELRIFAASVVRKSGDDLKVSCAMPPDMGLGAGGRMRQEIYKDERPLSDWDDSLTSRCFVHLCNSALWEKVTGQAPPQPPIRAAEYAKHGLPWFDTYRDDLNALDGSTVLSQIKSIFHLGQQKGTSPLPENESTTPTLLIQYGTKRRPEEVREWVE